MFWPEIVIKQIINFHLKRCLVNYQRRLSNIVCVCVIDQIKSEVCTSPNK